jgi:hypothetical protein
VPNGPTLDVHDDDDEGAFLVSSERRSTKEQSIEYCGWAGCV